MSRTNAATSPTDIAIGTRIRERRITIGLSQGQLAQMVGVTYQQLHKYERGINRVSAGRLQQIADALGTTVGALFDGLGMALSPPAEGLRLAMQTSALMQEMPTWARQTVADLARTLHEQTVEAAE